MVIKRSLERRIRAANTKGQMIIEYAIMFTVIVAVILAASVMIFQPAVNRFFNASNRIITRAVETVENNF